MKFLTALFVLSAASTAIAAECLLSGRGAKLYSAIDIVGCPDDGAKYCVKAKPLNGTQSEIMDKQTAIYCAGQSCVFTGRVFKLNNFHGHDGREKYYVRDLNDQDIARCE